MNSKRIFACLMALALVLGSAGALAADWYEAYNRAAEKYSVDLMPGEDFYYDEEGNYYIFEFDYDTAFGIQYDRGGEPWCLIMEAKKGDERLKQVLACAMTATDGTPYEEALETVAKIVSGIPAEGEEDVGADGNWLYVSYCYTEDGVTYDAVALWPEELTDSGINRPDAGGSGEEQPRAEEGTPEPTDNPEYINGKRVFKA